MSPPSILRVAVPAPFLHGLDYLPPHGIDAHSLRPGMRLRVPLGGRTTVGLLLGVAEQPCVEVKRLRHAQQVLDESPVVPRAELDLLLWASDYYHHSPGEVLFAGIPVLLRKGARAQRRNKEHVRLTAEGLRVQPDSLARRAPRQQAVLAQLLANPGGFPVDALRETGGRWRPALEALRRNGWVEPVSPGCAQAAPILREPPPAPGSDQLEAAQTVLGALGRFGTFLLDGITGSGKTEVYLRIIEEILRRGEQALVLVPEIGLTPQLVGRFRARFTCHVALLHSALSNSERLEGWLDARDGRAAVVIGTRSTIFTPLARPGVLIVDEEHDDSYKQEDGFRYNARDVAVMRARRLGVPIVLGTATPALETLHNVATGRYTRLTLRHRAAGAQSPAVSLLDVRRLALDQGLSKPLLDAIRETLNRGQQVLLFLNRRGYAPVLMCTECGWSAECKRCDARMTLHRSDRRLKCHHCSAEKPAPSRCPACDGEGLRVVGQGTERIGEALSERFPDVPVVRIDRDNTRRKGALEALLEQIRSGQAQLLVGTQMLAKGHHFPGVTLVGIVDADPGLFSTDFRASERLAHLIVQVAGRAGRAREPGRVLIQTHFPEHPLLRLLVSAGYAAFAEAALAERRAAGLPPWTHLALLRAEAVEPDPPLQFLQTAAQAAGRHSMPGVDILGPVAAAMQRRAGRYRAQLLLRCVSRKALHDLLGAWVPTLGKLPTAHRVRWALDVDPRNVI
jgi:primosomal protein N' (replication factor Y)